MLNTTARKWGSPLGLPQVASLGVILMELSKIISVKVFRCAFCSQRRVFFLGVGLARKLERTASSLVLIFLDRHSYFHLQEVYIIH